MMSTQKEIKCVGKGYGRMTHESYDTIVRGSKFIDTENHSYIEVKDVGKAITFALRAD